MNWESFAAPDAFRIAASALVFFGCYQVAIIASHVVLDIVTVGRSSIAGERRERSAVNRVFRGLGAAFEWIAVFIPGSIIARNESRMIYAGRPFGGITARRYFAAVISLGVIAGFAYAGSYVALNFGEFSPRHVALALLLSPFAAFLIASASLDSAQIASRVEIENEFPFFLDLALLVVQAGGTPLDALESYIEASPDTLLAKELAVTLKDAEASSVDAALLRLSDRIESMAVKTILRNLAQAERTSGRLAAFYVEQAIELRSIRHQLAEQAAERIRVNIKIPEVMIAAAIALATTGPSILQLGLF